MYGVKVYPADSVQQIYYTDMYTNIQGNGGQWANGTLGSKTAALYEQNNCDSFYVVATIYTDGARNWSAYDDGIIIGQGQCTTIPNAYSDFSMLIRCKSNPAGTDYGFWKVKLHDGNITNAWELWGAIHLPN